MRILITGVAGFIGSNLADRLLKEGHSVVGIDSLIQGHESQVAKEVAFHGADIRSKDVYPLFRGVDAVYHLAAFASVPGCQKDPIAAADVNVTGTVNIFEAAKQAGVKKVMYAETSAVYEGIDTLPTDESKVNPQSFYAISKLCTNFFADGYRRFSGLNTVAFRYFNVYGPRQDYARTVPPVMSAFIIKLLRGEQPIIYGTGKKKRDFVHVDDVNDFHVLCLKDDRVNGKVFNIGSGENYSVTDIYNMVAEIIGVKNPPEYKLDLEGEAQETLADIGSAKALGWSPKVNIKDGLREMVEYIRKEIERGNIK